MSDEHDEKGKEKETPEEPAKQFAEGIGMLFKAAKGAAKGIKKELDRTNVGKAFEDAGREFARAATNSASSNPRPANSGNVGGSCSIAVAEEIGEAVKPVGKPGAVSIGFKRAVWRTSPAASIS